MAALLTAVEDAETGQRGFLLTGKPEYLAPYENAVRTLPGKLDTAARLLANDATAVRDVARIRDVTAVKLAELARAVSLERTGDHAGALAVVRSDTGERAMELLRTLSGELTESRNVVVRREIGQIVAGDRLLIVFDLLGFGLILLLAAAVGNAARRGAGAVQNARTMLAVANARLERANETLEEKVDQRTADLTEANEQIQRFAYIVSHDLRAPLVNIMGFTSELEAAGVALAGFIEMAAAHVPPAALAEIRGAAEEDLPEAIRFIKTSAAKMDRLIGAILRLSRQGRRVLTPERIAMHAMLLGIVESMAIQLVERGVSMELGDVPDVISDRLALEQVFSNLLENAAKYLKPGRPGKIVLHGHISGSNAVFEVEDNGRGIAPRDYERIFELFRRAGDQDVPGEGIGLAHVRALVRRLGGKIDCVSKLDVGSTFRVQIPLVLVQGGAN